VAGGSDDSFEAGGIGYQENVRKSLSTSEVVKAKRNREPEMTPEGKLQTVINKEGRGRG